MKEKLLKQSKIIVIFNDNILAQDVVYLFLLIVFTILMNLLVNNNKHLVYCYLISQLTLLLIKIEKEI